MEGFSFDVYNRNWWAWYRAQQQKIISEMKSENYNFSPLSSDEGTENNPFDDKQSKGKGRRRLREI